VEWSSITLSSSEDGGDMFSETSVLTKAYQYRVPEDKKQTNSVALSPQANYTDLATATCRRNLVPTFVDRGVSRGQRGGSPTVVNLSFLDQVPEDIYHYYRRADIPEGSVVRPYIHERHVCFISYKKTPQQEFNILAYFLLTN
jgi:hypothetical protein